MMDREEKLLLLFMVVAAFGLIFHVGTTNERMARDGYLPTRLTGDSNIYWYKPVTVDASPVRF